mgnify:FL=1
MFFSCVSARSDELTIENEPLIDSGARCATRSSRHRPDSLDIAPAAVCHTQAATASSILAQTLISGSLISGDGTPTQTPSDSGLVNPGFVFEFSGSATKDTTEVSDYLSAASIT